MAFFLLILVCILLMAVIYMSSLSGTYEVSVSKVIDADSDKLFDQVLDFHTWPHWSPWLMHEPDCPLEFSEHPSKVEGSYHWDGVHVGAGTMTHKVIDRPIRIEHELSITRPFKTTCQVTFDFQQVKDGALVRWSMLGSMPFLFRPMIRRLKETVAQEYALGLDMLTGRMSPSSEHPKIEFIGKQKREATRYIALPWEGKLEDLPAAMEKGFTELGEYIGANNIPVLGQPFTVYHKVKKRATYFVMDIAFPVAEDTTDDKYQVKTLKGGRFHQTQLKGSYRFLQSAWHCAITNVKMHKIKMDWGRPSVELYENDVREIKDTNELVTSIFLPVK